MAFWVHHSLQVYKWEEVMLDVWLSDSEVAHDVTTKFPNFAKLLC